MNWSRFEFRVPKIRMASVLVREQEAAEIRVERLGAGADRDEVVIGPQVGEFVFDEQVLERPDRAGTVRPVEHVRTGLGHLAEREVADAQGRGHLDPPVDRLERGVAVEEIEGYREEVQREEAVGPAEEVPRERALGALERGGLRGDLPRLEVEVGHLGDFQERVLAQEWVIALEPVLIEWVPQPAGHIRVIIGDRMALVVSVPGRVADPPSILDRDEMVGFLILRRQHAGRAGVSHRGIHRQLEQHSGRVQRLGKIERRGGIDRTPQHAGAAAAPPKSKSSSGPRSPRREED